MFGSFFDDLEAWLVGLLGGIWQFVKPLLRKGVGEVLEQLLPVALMVVANIAKDPTILSNDDKRNKAIKDLGDHALSIGITVGTSVLATAVELAVQKYKSDKDENPLVVPPNA